MSLPSCLNKQGDGEEREGHTGSNRHTSPCCRRCDSSTGCFEQLLPGRDPDIGFCFCCTDWVVVLATFGLLVRRGMVAVSSCLPLELLLGLAGPRPIGSRVPGGVSRGRLLCRRHDVIVGGCFYMDVDASRNGFCRRRRRCRRRRWGRMSCLCLVYAYGVLLGLLRH